MSTLLLGDIRHHLALVLATVTAAGRRLVPARRSRVTAICCPACGVWVKPRHFRVPAMACRTCTATNYRPTRAGRR